MGINAWSLLIAPALLPATAIDNQEIVSAASAQDIFSSEITLDDGAMRAATGGQGTAIDIQDLGINVASSEGSVSDVEVSNSNNGAIGNNLVDGNHGITTVFNNTGNGVVFQSTVQVNIFLNGQQ